MTQPTPPPSHGLAPTAAISRTVHATLAICGLELASRQVARRSLGALIGWSDGPSVGLIVGVAAVAAFVGVVALQRRHQRTAASSSPRPDRIVRLLLVASFVFGLAAQQHLGARIQSDGFFYFAYLRSLAFDHDVDLTNDYQFIGVGADRAMGPPTVTGYAHTAWSIGPALLWSPFFAAGHAVAHGLAAIGTGVKTDGTSFPYRQAVVLGSLFYGLLGFWYAYRLAARFFDATLAATAMAFMALASFMLWYVIKEPSMSHALSMAAVAVFLYGWVATGTGRTRWQWAWLGVVAGLMLAVRWQNLVFLALPAIDVARDLLRCPRADRVTLVVNGSLFAAGAALAFLPQALAWQAIYGSPLAVSPLSPKMFWWHPEIVLTLWSSRNGLFATSPITYVGAAGLLLFAWRERTFGVKALLLFVLAVYVNSVVADWWGGAAYGARRFDGTIPLLIIGLAAAIDRGRSWLTTRPLAGVVGALALLVVWNWTSMAATINGTYTLSAPRSFETIGAEQTRVLHRWIGHPFSYPVSLIYAGRFGVSPARWDLMAFGFLGDPELPYGRIDVGGDDAVYLGDGWHAVDTSPDGQTARWTGREAELFLPLDHAAPLLLQLRVLPFTWPGGPTPQLRVVVNGRDLGVVTAAAEWQRIEIPTEASAWHAGLNRVRLVALAPGVPARVGVNGDTRELGVAVDYVRVQVIK